MAEIHRLGPEPPHSGRRRRRLRGTTPLPALLTLGNLLCGFAAIHMCLRSMLSSGLGVAPDARSTFNNEILERLLPSYISMGCFLIIVGMLFDMFDGRVARRAKTTSQFGAQLDSLADIVTFGVAPALLMLTLMSRQLRSEWIISLFSDQWIGRICWVLAAVYVACAALRLARFNVETTPDEAAHMSFRGLPSPGAAATMVALLLLHEHIYVLELEANQLRGGWASQWLAKSMPWVAATLGLLMVSRVSYVHIANSYLRGRRPFTHLIKLMIIMAVLLSHFYLTLAALTLAYAVSGPVVWLLRRFGVIRHPPWGPALPHEETEPAAPKSDQHRA